MVDKNNNCDCRMDDIEYTIVLNEQGPQGRQGRQGEDGFSPSITVSVDTPSVYQLTITTKDQVINTPNLKANIPDPTFNGAVLMVNEDAALGYAWQELPWGSTEQRGTVQLATDSDLTPDPEMGYNDVVPTIEQLANEVNNRTTADSTLQSNIDNEATARQEADTTLQNNIDTLEQSVTEGLATKQDTLTAGTNIEITSENIINNTYSYTLPQATAEALGGIKANARTEDDTQEIKIDTATGILYTTPTGGTGGTDDYTELENKPSINNVTLQGNLTLEQLGIQAAGDYVSTGELNTTLNNYVTTDTAQTVPGKKNFTNGASLSTTSKLTADDGEGVNEYDLIFSNGLVVRVGDERLSTTIHTVDDIDIERPDGDGTSTTYKNIDTGNLSENVQPLLSNLATKEEVNTLTGTVTNLETNKQDKLTAGDGITIEDNVISATGGGGGGTADAYTKAETDELLATKQDLINNVQAPLEYQKTTFTNTDNKTYNENNFTEGTIQGQTLALPRIGYNPSQDRYSVTIAGYLSSGDDDAQLPYISLPNSLVYKGKVDDKYFTFSSISSGSTKWANAALIFAHLDSDNRLGNFIGVSARPTGSVQSIQVVEFDMTNPSVLTSGLSSIGSNAMPHWGVGYKQVPNVSWGEDEVIFARVYADELGQVKLDYIFKPVLEDGTFGETNGSGSITLSGSNYAGNGVNAVLLPIASGQTYNYNRLGAFDLNLQQVWQANNPIEQININFNYDSTLSVNSNNELTVNTSGLNIPTTTSELSNDSGFITKDVSNLTNYTPTSGLATVATTGSYNDLSDKPTIPSEYTLPAATTTTLGGVKPDGTTITITEDGTISSTGGGTGGTDDYSELNNKPQINSVTLVGNKTLGDLGIQPAGSYATAAQGTNADTAIANLNGMKFWSGSQSAYDGLATKDSNTLYIITG